MMNRYNIVFVGVLTIITITDQKRLLRIISGDPVRRSHYHYVLAIAYMDEMSFNEIIAKWAGSAALIAPTWALTAGHCIKDEMEHTSVLLYGDIKKNAIVKRVTRAVRHPNYQQMDGLREFNILSNDIGLLMTERFDVQKFAKVSAVDYTSLVGRPVTHVGTGANVTDNEYYEGKFQIPQITLSHDMRPLASTFSKLSFKGIALKCTFVKPIIRICVRPKCANRIQRIHYGDSGGPLFYLKRIVGVASDADDYDSESCFTPVSPYIDWIDSVIKQNKTRLVYRVPGLRAHFDPHETPKKIIYPRD